MNDTKEPEKTFVCPHCGEEIGPGGLRAWLAGGELCGCGRSLPPGPELDMLKVKARDLTDT